MIKTLEINGFKSFVSEEIKFRQLNILSGLNSSGKSSVIQALQLIESALKTENVYLPGHGHISESRNPFVENGIVINCTYSDGSFIQIDENKVTNLSGDLSNRREIIYITADRLGPETLMVIDPTSLSLGKRGENIFNVIDHYENFEINPLVKHESSQGDTFLFNLQGWLNIISPNSGFKHFVERKTDSSYSTFNGFRAKNVGFGLSYALPVITALLLGALAPQNHMVIIENPEAHLHPRGQTEMARLICMCANAGVQVLIETHSDHLFDGIRLFTKNNVNFHSKVISYWFELDDNRNTQVEEVEFDQKGRVKNWPEGMFDQFSINASKLL